MAFQNGAFAKIWEFTDKGKYGIINLSTSKKNKDTGVYETDFQHKFVSVVGQAYEFAKGLSIPQNGASVKIGNCATTNKYDGEKKTTYWNCAVFALEDASFNGNGGNTAAAPASAKAKKNTPASDIAMLDDDDVQLPF